MHLRVRDLDASRRFYVAVAEALEVGPIKAGDGWFALGELFVSADGPADDESPLRLPGARPSVVERFYAAALAAGGRDNGAARVPAALPPRLLRRVRLRPRREQRRGRQSTSV